MGADGHAGPGPADRDLTGFAATLDRVLANGCGADLGPREVNDDFAVAATFTDE